MMKKKLISLVSLVIVCLLAAACGTLAQGAGALAQTAGDLGIIDQETAGAVTGAADAISKAAEEITPEQEYYIGRAVGANILTNYKIYSGNPDLTAYLNKICSTLVINSAKPELFNGYHVVILDSTEINAFSTSGGHILVTRGLIACTSSEDTLAAVIAHEIAHVQLQHSVKSIKTSRFTNAVLATGSAAATAAGTNTGELTEIFGESVNEAVNTMVNNGYSQTQEFAADSLALSLLASAGYTPSSLVEMLQSLNQKQSGQTGGFSKTHPTPAQRITNVNKTLNQYTVTDTRSFRTARYRAAQ
jgi:predicted Zn-dependent protease